MLQELVPLVSARPESEAPPRVAPKGQLERLVVRIAGVHNARVALDAAARGNAALKRGWRRTRETVANFIDRPAAASADEATTGAGVDPNPLGRWRTVAKRNFAAVGTFSIFVNLLMLTLPLYLFQLSDRVLTSRSLDTLFMLSVLAISLIAVLSLVDIFRREMLGALANRFQSIIGGPVVASVISSSHIGGGNVQAVRSLNHVRNFISSPTMLLLFDAPLSPLYFAVVFLINVQLGLIAFVSGLILTGIAALNQRFTTERLSRAGTHNMRADDHAEALARNSQVINAMGMMNEGILLWGKEQASALSWQFSALNRNFWISGTSKFFRLITQIGVLGWGAYLALSGEITGGMMIAASIIASRALQPLEGMIEGWRSVVQTRAAYSRVVSAVESWQREKRRLRLPRPQGRITVERLLFIPPKSKEPVVNGVTFALEPGESLAIVGPSGSGKSTLARMLVGCLQPMAGKIRLDGTELNNWDRRQFGQFTGYLPQEVELFPGTVRQNVCRMRDDLTDDKIYEAAKIAGVHEMIARLPDGYETVIEGSGAPLSGGQRQRVALARALFGDPTLIVLDEPNSNLDAEGEQALSETLQRAKQRGVTVIVVTQRPVLLGCVDKVLILRSGRVEALGPPTDVLRSVVVKPDVRPDVREVAAPQPQPSAAPTVAAAAATQ